MKIVDASYAGENGANQAIEMLTEVLFDAKFAKEKKSLSTDLREISWNSGKTCFGPVDIITALEFRAIETLIVWENLVLNRNTYKDAVTREITVYY